ncbi:hypothetical protein K435DRAFT_849267 [Dendrothele bispora CBS 962.96]|uniref:Kri1-like C-terminal domain-containing protein n=1 Tax=Dendrothele bispora (strain CBS 962.96) TaxID=1314807 RepID=A0A4S8MSQ0_DENBC|nr:hypothetical protein K435DRAFT_849267 [Dendrothele bispora CBS 962.96]
MLSDSESDSGDGHQLSINEHYAKAFQYRKEREELEKLKAKYGSDYGEDEEEDTDSESDESEDEEGEELTPAVDAAILRTLAKIKRKDPEIYDTKTHIFEEEQKKLGSREPKVRQRTEKSKPVTLRQVALEAALEHGSQSPEPEPLTHVEEQRQLRDETIAAFHAKDKDITEGDEDDFLVPREKTKDELEKEEEEYRTFLEREVGKDLDGLVSLEHAAESSDVDSPAKEDGDKKKKKKKRSKDKTDGINKKSKEEKDQEFLMSYILNRGWIDRSAKRVPTYGEITSSKGKGKAKEDLSDMDDEQDSENHPENEDDLLPTAHSDVDQDDFEDIVDRFESSYNFRFEEPDADVIKSYPRKIDTLIRREDTTRKDARDRRKKRKEEELQKKREEIKRLKALKMKEVRARLERIGREGGKNYDDDPALQELDLDGDWDPEKHDEQMFGLYGEDADYNDDEKPTWDDDIDIGDIVPDENPETSSKKEKKKKKKDKDVSQDDGVDVDDMDADVQRMDDDEEWDGTEEMRKRKMEEYMDEIYGLDFNDMVGGMPTRFHYTQVQSQNFALTPVEILMATDQELNEYMSIKKYAPYRQDGKKWDNKRNDRLQELKAKIAARSLDGGVDGSADDTLRQTKKRKGKKERMRARLLNGLEVDEIETKKAPESTTEETGKRKRADDDEAEVGGNAKVVDKPSKKKRRHRKKEGGFAANV